MPCGRSIWRRGRCCQPQRRPAQGEVRVVTMERERLVFETTAVGAPHLIRMTYHPKWRSLGGEPILLAEPAFLLIHPRQSRVELVYGETAGDRLGHAATLLGLLGLLAGLAVRRVGTAPQSLGHLPLRPLAGFLVVILALGGWGWLNDPERRYYEGHRLLAAEQWLAAAADFDYAYANRWIPAHRAEALFWGARARQFGDDLGPALAGYQELAERFPENYWAAEALFRSAEIAQQHGQTGLRQRVVAQLRSAYPDSPWSQQAGRQWPLLPSQTQDVAPELTP
jgi:hypothetical protein